MPETSDADWLAQSGLSPTVAPPLQTGLSPGSDAEWLAQGQTQDAAKLGLSAQQGLDRNPDMVARVWKLKAKTGLPGELIERNLDDIEKKAAAADFDPYQFRRTSPVVAQWVSEHPDHYALVREDLDKMGTWEALWKSVSFRAGANEAEYGRLGTQARDFYFNSYLLNDGAKRDPVIEKRIAEVQRRMQAEPEGGGTFLGIIRGTTKWLGQWGSMLPKAVGVGAATGIGAAGATALAGQAGPQIALPEEVVTVPAAAAGGFLAGFSSSLAADVFATEGGQSYLDMRDMGIDESTATAASTGVGVLNMGLELVGAHAMVAPFKAAGRKFIADGITEALARPTGKAAILEFGKAYAESVGTEVGTEVLQEVVSIAGEEIGKSITDGDIKHANAGDVVERLLTTATETLKATVLTGGLGAGTHSMGMIREARQAQRRVDVFKAIGDTSKDMALTKRLPPALQELVGRMTKDGPVENLYIPADAWVEHFQSKGVDPRAVAQEVIGDTKAYDQAVESGADIAIPTAKYAEKIAPTEHHAAFVDELKTNPLHMNGKEAEQFFAELEKQDKASPEAGLSKEEQAAFDLLRDDKEAQLIQAGTDPSAARAQASFYAKTIQALAQRTGMDALALAERFPMEIQRAVPAALQNGQVDTLDLMLDQLRAGRLPTDQEIKGKTLVEFLRERGGISGDTGEVQQLEIDKALRKPFQKRLVHEKGMQLDTAAEAAVEAGYLEKRDINQLLDALKMETLGKPVFSPMNEAHSLREQRDALEELQSFLDDNGIDLATEDNATIKAKLQEQSRPEPQREAAQTELNQRLSDLGIKVPTKWMSPALSMIDTMLEWPGMKDNLEAVQNLGFDDAEQALDAIMANSDWAERWDVQRGRSEKEDAALTYLRGARTKAVNARPESFPGDGVIYRQDGKRASIRFGKDRKFVITLFSQANLSSFLHESGHFYLEVLGDLAQDANAPEQIKADYQKILDWFGVKSRDEITSEHHEQWARGFERYLMEGKAPSSALREIFARFKAWLVTLYRNVTALNAPITDEIRGVMDRLVATDEEIAAAEQDAGVSQTFATAEDAKMSAEEFAAYKAKQEEASQVAREKLERKLMAEYQREREAWYLEAREKTREQVAAQVAERREYIALANLKTGKLPDGSPLPEGMTAVKLDRSKLSPEMAAKLPKGVSVKKGGLDPEVAADLFGYRNAQEMALALINAKPMREVIEAETDTKMVEEHGDLRLDGSIHEAAREAVQNDERLKVVQAELAAIRRLQRESKPVVTQKTKEAVNAAKAEGKAKLEAEKADRAVEKALDKAQRRNLFERLPNLDQVRQEARRRIGDLRVKDVNPHTYWVAARRASRDALKAFNKKDYQAAGDAKSKELLNLELYRMASEAHDEIESAVKFLRGFERDARRKRLGLAGEDYLEQVDGILERFSLVKLTKKAQAEREALAAWIANKEAIGESLGEEISVPPAVLNEANRQHYTTLTVDELLGLRDTIRQINHMANKSRESLTDAKKREREELKGEMIAAAGENLKKRGPPPLTKNGLSFGDRAKRFLTGWDARLIKMETLIDWLDGGKIDGPWRQGLFNGASDAQAAQLDYDKRIGAKVAQAVRSIPAAIRKRMSERVSIPGLERVVTRKDLIGVALNVGNESNYNKLLKGMGWDASQVQAMVDHLTPEEIAFVNSIHETLESLWPDIAKLQREMTGLEPKKIEARPFQAKNGTIKGGYYPLMYDSKATEQGELQLASTIGGLVEPGYTRATTPRGHTQARVENFSAPFDLDIDRLPSHTAGVIKDLTHRKWLMDANWLVHNKDIKATIREHLGDDYVDLFSDWVRQVVNDRNQRGAKVMRGATGMIEKFRYNAMIAALGFKVSSLVSQAAGLGPAIGIVGKKWMFEGFKRFVSHPAEAMQFIRENSGEMRHRLDTRDQGMREQLEKLSGRTDLIAEIQRFSMTGIGWADMMVSAPTWIGAYHRAISEGHSHEDAVHAGDRAVRLSQGSGGAKDLSAIAADRGAWRLLTMFYTPFSALYAQLRQSGHDLGEGKVGSALHRAFWSWIVAATVGELLAGHGPDDDEGWLKWWLKAVTVYPFLAIPGVRDLASAALSDYGYSFSPLAQAGNAVAGVAATAGKVIDPDSDKGLADLAESTYKASKYLLGLPTSQVEITGGYLRDLMTGDADPEDIGEFAHDLFYRRRHR